MSDLTEVLRRRLEVVIGTPFTEGNSITVLRNGDEIFPAMLDAGVQVEWFRKPLLKCRVTDVP